MLEANPELSLAVATIRRFSKDKEAWIEYKAEEKARKDYRTHMLESEARVRIEIAYKMLSDGVALEGVAKYTNLSVKELEKLRNKE